MSTPGVRSSVAMRLERAGVSRGLVEQVAWLEARGYFTRFRNDCAPELVPHCIASDNAVSLCPDEGKIRQEIS